MDVQKPPLGLKPKWLHEWERTIAIVEAIERYSNAGMVIPKEWISELKERLVNNQREE